MWADEDRIAEMCIMLEKINGKYEEKGRYVVERQKWEKAASILVQNEKSDDLKLYEVFQLYKDEIKNNNSQLYYALLGWKDAHLSELLKERGQ